MIFMLFWFSISFSTAAANFCCMPKQASLSELYKSKLEGVESCLYIYLELPKISFLSAIVFNQMEINAE